MALPAAVWWVVFFAVPVVLVIAASFGRKVPSSAGRVSYSTLTLDNYHDALEGGFGLLAGLWHADRHGTLASRVHADVRVLPQLHKVLGIP